MPEAGAARFHPDQGRFVEDHRQTEHKLDLYRRYAPRWGSIMATARGGYFDPSHLFLIDGFAGAGIHRSREHPDGALHGTALLACYTARDLQRRHRIQVHVRLIERNPAYCRVLEMRTAQFRDSEGRDRVDVEVINEPFASAVHPILMETEPRGRQYRNLWLVDPYGTSDIPHWSLEELDRARHGPEVLINLATGAVLRQCGRGPQAGLDPAHEAHLQELYGGTLWRRAFAPGAGAHDATSLLARLYRQSFPGSRYGGVLPLRKTGGQLRHFIHLAKSPAAEKAFMADYEASFKVGLLAAKALNEAEKANAAQQLFDAFRGEGMTVEEMFRSQVTQLDRGQLRSVMGVADRSGFGRWDHETSTMHWRLVRIQPTELLLDFG